MRGNSSLTAVGTVSYMAPEVYKMEPYDKTVDIYSLGLVLYELLNHGRMPFLPAYPETVSLIEQADAQARRMRGEPFPLPDNASKELGKVLCKACEKAPAKRYQSATAFKVALEQCGREDGSKYAGSSLYRTETLVVNNDRKGKSLIKYIIAIVAAVFIATGIFLFAGKKPSENGNTGNEVPEAVTERAADTDESIEDVKRSIEAASEPETPEQDITEEDEPANEDKLNEEPPQEEPVEEKVNPAALYILPTAVPEEYYYYNGHTYAFYDASRYGFTTYDEVSGFCHEQGGHLAVINDRGENSYLYNLMKDNYKITVFFGYTDKDQEGVWIWDGDESDYENWTRTGDWDLPDNGESWGGGEWKNGGEDYAEFNYDRDTNWGAPNDTTWNDATFMENTSIFFCEWDYDMREAEEAQR